MTLVVCEKCGSKNRVDEQAAKELQAKCGRCGAKLEITKVNTGKPLYVTDSTFAHDVLQAGAHPVLLDCWAPWCGPCRAIAPVLDELAAEANGKYLIAKLNVDDNPRTASQFQIQSIPTMLIFKNGALVDRIVGALPKSAIAARLEKVSGS
jgi:thioredoxin 2